MISSPIASSRDPMIEPSGGGNGREAKPAEEKLRLPRRYNRAVILPMSGRKLNFVTAGMPSMGGGFGASMLNGRAGGEVVHIEVTPGIVIVVAAWMLDPAACTGMALGAPCVSVSALVELHPTDSPRMSATPGDTSAASDDKQPNVDVKSASYARSWARGSLRNSAKGKLADPFSRRLSRSRPLAVRRDPDIAGRTLCRLAFRRGAGIARQALRRLAFRWRAGVAGGTLRRLAVGRRAGVAGRALRRLAVGRRPGVARRAPRRLAARRRPGIAGRAPRRLAVRRRPGVARRALRRLAARRRPGIAGRAPRRLAVRRRPGVARRAPRRLAVRRRPGIARRAPRRLAVRWRPGVAAGHLGGWQFGGVPDVPAGHFGASG